MISPITKGAIVGDPSLAAVAANTAAFQACLDEQAKTYAPIEIPGKFYLGPVVSKAPIFLMGKNRLYSQLLLDARDPVTGADRDAALFDLHANAVSPSGSIIERVGFYSVAGQEAAKRHVGFQFRRTGSSNRNVKIVDSIGAKFSDAFVELPNSWNCTFMDLIGDRCGRPASATGWGEEGAFLRLGFQDAVPDTMVSSGNVLKNFYMSGCNHGISCQPDNPNGPYGGLYYLLLFQKFEQIYAEGNRIGIYAPTSMDCVLDHCYFEANTEHGAVMGHAHINCTRHLPGTTDDIVLNPDMFPWEEGVAHHEYFVSERVVTVPTDDIRELWAPKYGLVSFAPSNTDYGPLGIARVRTAGTPKIKALAGLSGHPVILAVGSPDLTLWPGKFAILANEGELWVQNRTGFSVDFTYHVMGPPWN